MKKDQRYNGVRQRGAADGKLTPGQGLNLTGAYQRSNALIVSS